MALLHFLLEEFGPFCRLFPQLTEVVDDGTQVYRHVDVYRIRKLDVLDTFLSDTTEVDSHSEPLNRRLPVTLRSVEVVERALGFGGAISLVLLLQAAGPIVVYFFARDEEHRDEVASVFINDDDVGALLHLKLHCVLGGDILLKFALFIALGHDFPLLIVLPHLPDLERLLTHFLGKLLDYVEVVHGDLRLNW